MRMQCAVASAVGLAVLATAPASGQLGLVSERQELEAGRQADAEIVRKHRISRDPYWNNLVRHLGRRLAAASERSELPWTFRVIDSDELNAFSVPGYVYVNTGLLEAARADQDAVAGVIAHEIAHTTGRHAAKQMEKGTIGALLVGLIGGRNRTVGTLANVAANLVMLGYGRDDENDADRRAVRCMLRAGYDPNGLVRFFEMLERRGDRGGGGLATYFRTHPPTGDRIKRVREIISQERGRPRDDSDRRARIRAGDRIEHPDPRREERSRQLPDPWDD